MDILQRWTGNWFGITHTPWVKLWRDEGSHHWRHWSRCVWRRLHHRHVSCLLTRSPTNRRHSLYIQINDGFITAVVNTLMVHAIMTPYFQRWTSTLNHTKFEIQAFLWIPRNCAQKSHIINRQVDGQHFLQDKYRVITKPNQHLAVDSMHKIIMENFMKFSCDEKFNESLNENFTTSWHYA